MCTDPFRAYKSAKPNHNGKYPITFDIRKSEGEVVQLPCGKCIECRYQNSRKWAVRCIHEAQMHKSNTFITLTYDEKNIPIDESLDYTHFQLFMKRLRKYFGPEIRFYMAGEYGEKLGRPHYHSILFNMDFPDKKLYTIRNGYNLYTSEVLSTLWGKGMCMIGDVCYESTAYVARYIMKKIGIQDKLQHYLGKEGIIKKPEFTQMSRKPGIGKPWLDKYIADVYPKDNIHFMTKKGMKVVKPPRYYDKILEKNNIELYEEIKHARYTAMREKMLSLEDQEYHNFARKTMQIQLFSNTIRSFEQNAIP